jgi:RAB protein geranylgeranyltransferase component A
MEESQFDAVILGTGLVNSITAAALSKAGYKVAHIDSNAYYGDEEASLSLEEVVKWVDSSTSTSSTCRFQRISRSPNVPSQSRQYSICLQPAIIPSVGPLISSLVSSGVAKYNGFKLLESVSIYDSPGKVKSVPGSKEDIFKNKQISLIEKRRLMRFLTFAAGEFEDQKELEGKAELPFPEFLRTIFSLSEEIASVITYALAFCMSPNEPALPTLVRLRKYLRSGGRYGPSPFLIGHYGGIGDIAQGFCRASAVSGGVYILGRNITSIAPFDPSKMPKTSKEQKEGNENIPNTAEADTSKAAFKYSVDLEDFPDTLSCNLIVSTPSYIPQDLTSSARHLPTPSRASSTEFKSDVAAIARCIAIVDQALNLRSSEAAPAPEAETEAGDTAGSAEDEPAHETTPKRDESPVDTAVLVLPPSSVEEGSTTHAATALINGESSLSTPAGKCKCTSLLLACTRSDMTLQGSFISHSLCLVFHRNQYPQRRFYAPISTHYSL